jgi:hypothetical protein
VGFTGDFVVVRSDRPLLELPQFAGDDAGCREGDKDCFHLCGSRPGGWQTLQVLHGLSEDSDWLDDLVQETGSPVIIASVFDSDLCDVRGLAADGSAAWSAALDPQAMVDYEIPAGEALELSTREENLGWYLAAIPSAVAAVAAWSTASGVTPDREELAIVLGKRADPFVEDLFFELLDAAGLPASIAETDQDDPDCPAHPMHRAGDYWRNPPRLERAVLNMRRDSHLVLECVTAPNCYAQVWLRPDGSYQLEYRDRSPSEHYQTRTLSQEKVASALSAWVAGEITWRDDFQWTPIGDWFAN